MTFLIVILFNFLIPQKLSLNYSLQKVIIWNVGQGQWITYSTNLYCYHFDMGGEKINNFNKIYQECSYKKNLIFISHWDNDHVNYIKKSYRSFSNICLVNKESNRLTNVPINNCKSNTINKNIYKVSLKKIIYKARQNKKNDLSQIYSIKQKILIPGDSTTYMEKYWIKKIKLKYRLNLKYLILGHHGSKTSTSNILLNNIPNVHTAIASARAKKYGHPHNFVKQKLLNYNIVLLQTELWNNIFILFK